MQQRLYIGGFGALGFVFWWWIETIGGAILKAPGHITSLQVLVGLIAFMGYLVYWVISGSGGLLLLMAKPMKFWLPPYLIALVAMLGIYKMSGKELLPIWWTGLMLLKALGLSGAAFVVLASIWDESLNIFNGYDDEEELEE